MELENLLTITTRKELRSWLEENATTQKCCWVIVSMKEVENKILYLDAVEEALCFGWIDGVKKKINDIDLAQRLSPRSKNSNWTELNKERVRVLDKHNLLTEEGRKVLPCMDKSAFIIDPLILEAINKDSEVLENFNNFPELYNRIKIDNIQSVKKDEKLFNTRLEKFISSTKENKMYGKWNDDGRLL